MWILHGYSCCLRLKIQNPLYIFEDNDIENLRKLQSDFFIKPKKIRNNVFEYKDYLLPINNFGASILYYEHGIEMVENLEIIKNKCILDVGGFIGDSVLVLSKIPCKHIYTFEAIPDNFKLMEQTFALNETKNVTIENVAIGSQKGELSLSVNFGCSTSVESDQKSSDTIITVPMISLDEYVQENNIEVGLIKVDIEGAEPEFLKGAENTICQQKPIILLSIYHNAHDFFELKPLIESWGLGYNFKIYKPVDGAIVRETLLICEVL